MSKTLLRTQYTTYTAFPSSSVQGTLTYKGDQVGQVRPAFCKPMLLGLIPQLCCMCLVMAREIMRQLLLITLD